MYKIIKDFVDGRISKQRAATKLNKSTRTVERRAKEYKEIGKEAFVHKNKNKKPASTISSHTKKTILKLYNEKYYDCNFKHFSQLLSKYEDIKVSESFIRNLMKQSNIISPKCNKKTKRSHLKALQENNIISDTIIIDDLTSEEIEYTLLEFSEAHPRRERAKYEGELIQMDASVHLWFGDTKTHLHAAIDDASGKIVGLFFDEQETLFGYQNIYHQILTNYGIPYEFLTDKRTVFEYNKKNASSLEEDTFTQFGYSCHQLGTTISTSSIPQAKGRIERLFNTLQSRLPVELRLHDITSIEEANLFLLEYINEFNNQFALHINDTKNAYVDVENIEDINLILSKLSTRKIDNGGCISYQNNYYYPTDEKDNKVILPSRAKVLVIDTFDKQLYLSVNNKIYALSKLNRNKSVSKEFDPAEKKMRALAGKFTPAMSHPWKRESFLKYASKQKHIKSKEFEQMTNSF